MNRVEQLKEMALNYAKTFEKTDEINLDFKETLNNAEWYIVLQLAQIYYNLIKKIITRQKAIEQQRNVFAFVNNNKSFFAYKSEVN